MAEKRKFSLEVIKEYQKLLNTHEGNKLAVVYEWSEKLLPHKSKSPLKDLDFDGILALMTGNYEVTLSPKERILEYYFATEWVQEKDAINFVLNTLNIEIEGINKEEGQYEDIK